MSSRIQLLPESLINKIAAGEVVERPASVVKELLENSIDAGATRITLEVESGGKHLLRISDNGEGMSADDALLSIERHCTSKLKSERDLFAIRSLGFRGEALPSIAAVSRFLLRSRDHGSELGSLIRVDAGVVREVKSEAMPQGTTVEVRSLFFNVPARRKFLKSAETELGHITELVNKIAFAYPGISFELFHQGKPLLRAQAAARMDDRAYQIFGSELAAKLAHINMEFEGLFAAGSLRVSGLISPPELTFSTTRHLYLYINGRYVRDKLLTHSILEAYRTMIPKIRYPAVVLFLEMPAEEVDVNVHPTKLEVRFPQAGKIYQAVMDTIQPALLSRPQALISAEVKEDEHKARVENATQKFFMKAHPGLKLESKPVQARMDALYDGKRSLFPPGAPEGERGLGLTSREGEREKTSEPGTEPAPSLRPTFSGLKVLGQFHANYLLLESEDSLIVIDQHAAHERINFEKLKLEFSSNQLNRQNLLFPEVVELDFQRAELIGKNLDLIQSLGFDLQAFGGNSFVIKTTPGLLRNLDLPALVADLADELAEVGKLNSIDDRIDHLLSVIACHSSVRAGQALSGPEIQALLKEMDERTFPGQCPHGRPAIWRLPLREIEKKFSR